MWEDVRKILSTLCKYKKVEIIAAAVYSDYVHLSVVILPKGNIIDEAVQYKRAGRGIKKRRFKKYRFISGLVTILAIPPFGASSNISPLEG